MNVEINRSKTLFTEQINNWDEWGKIFQSIPAFASLVNHILKAEGLPASEIENLTPGTNAVFKTGRYVVKIYAPAESGIDQTLDLHTELFSTARANRIGVSAPRLTAHGFVQDKYCFAYMITEYVEGVELTDAVKTMSDAGKTELGRRLRIVTDKMNTACESFNGINVIEDECRHRRWDKRYSERFKAERLAYIRSHDYGENVFVHGDLCGDNIVLTPQGELVIVDFADAVLAPIEYEHALVAVELFGLDPVLLRGYFGNYTADNLTDLCFNGLLIHDFGGDIVAQHIGIPEKMTSINAMQERLFRMIK